MAEPLIARLGELALKLETTKGTKNLPAVDGTESTFRVFDLAWQDNPTLFNRRTYAKSLSRYPHLVGQTICQVTGRIELRKNATTNTEDAWGVLLRAAGLSFTTGVYKFNDDTSTHPTLTVLVWTGSNGATALRRGLRGCMMAGKIMGKVGEPMMIEFTIYGVHDTADSDLVAQMDPLNTITHATAIPGIFNAVTSLTFNGSSEVKMSSFEVDFGTQVVERQNVASQSGVEHFAVVDRDVTVTLDPEVPLTSAINWHSLLCVGTECALALTHTQPATSSPSVAVATFAFAFPKCQIEALSEGERNGIKTFGVTLKPNLSAEPGADEFTLTITKAT